MYIIAFHLYLQIFDNIIRAKLISGNSEAKSKHHFFKHHFNFFLKYSNLVKPISRKFETNL